MRLESIEWFSKDMSCPYAFLAKLALPAGEQILLVEIKRVGEPRLAREAINALFRCRETFPDAYGILIAPYISPQTAKLCEQEGIGYIDLTGNCRLSFGQVFIERGRIVSPPLRFQSASKLTVNPIVRRGNPFTEKRTLRSFYSPKAERVLRVLLNDPCKEWKMQPLAHEAKVSL